jgi:hypothetical protein
MTAVTHGLGKVDKVDKVARRTFGLNDAGKQYQQTLVSVQILNER